MSYFDSDSDESTKKQKYNADEANNVTDADNIESDYIEEEPETLSAVIALEVQIWFSYLQKLYKK